MTTTRTRKLSPAALGQLFWYAARQDGTTAVVAAHLRGQGNAATDRNLHQRGLTTSPDHADARVTEAGRAELAAEVARAWDQAHQS